MELPALTKKIGAFTLVGVVGACFDFGTRTLLLNLGVIGFVARACSYIVGSTVAYYLNSFFTFQGIVQELRRLVPRWFTPSAF